MASFIGKGNEAVWHVKQPITVCFVQLYVSERGSVATITIIELDYGFERLYTANFKYFTYFWKSSIYLTLITVRCHICKHDDFFREGAWRHGIFKEHDRHVSRKSCRIQPIRGRLRHSWSVSRWVSHMHQMFSQRSVGVTSEAEAKCYPNFSLSPKTFL